MILLRKKKEDGTYFDFDRILREGYNINEQPNVTAQKQMANGKRKKIITNYTDCVISVNLGLLDNETYQKYKDNLVDGEYQYFSFRDNKMKNANFLITIPEIAVEFAFNNTIGIGDIIITLEKSSDV